VRFEHRHGRAIRAVAMFSLKFLKHSIETFP